MKPSELSAYLGDLLTHDLRLSAMIWGAPGIGKSSIVAQASRAHGIDLIDLRLSQLAPTDLRGLPVPHDDYCTWLAPEFLPREGRGVLFLDEINMAPPAMQGVAQQLILDRKVGNYVVPDGWFVWAAGNRKEDRASVFDMPTPLANRFIHLHLEISGEDFRQHAYTAGFDERLIAFLAFRADLLHRISDDDRAWPSPRSWEMANKLLAAGLDMEPAVGTGPASEFDAYLRIVDELPDLDRIVAGEAGVAFPQEPSLRYAAVMGLVGRCKNTAATLNVFRWLVANAPVEWTQLFATDLFPQLRARGEIVAVHEALLSDSHLRDFLAEFSQLAASA